MEKDYFNLDISSVSGYTRLDDYPSNQTDDKELERTINNLISQGSASYDFNHSWNAVGIFKKVLEICLENETSPYPKFMNEALCAAQHIQFAEGDYLEDGNWLSHIDKVELFYNEKFSR